MRPIPEKDQIQNVAEKGNGMSSGKTWYLDNVARIAAEHPETFRVPDRQDIEELIKNVWVQLYFASEISGQKTERMWVRITRIDGQRFIGKLANNPKFVPDLRYRDIILFQRFHIAKILVDEKADAI